MNAHIRENNHPYACTDLHLSHRLYCLDVSQVNQAYLDLSIEVSKMECFSSIVLAAIAIIRCLMRVKSPYFEL